MTCSFTAGRSWVAFLLLLVSCTERPDSAAEPAAKSQPTRQELIRTLTSNFHFYHSSDADAARPTWKDGGFYSVSHGPGRKFITYRSRQAMHAELNRMLDSLKATGPMLIDNKMGQTPMAADYPPLSNTTAVTSTSNSTVASWVEGDSAATVARWRWVDGDSIPMP